MNGRLFNSQRSIVIDHGCRHSSLQCQRAEVVNADVGSTDSSFFLHRGLGNNLRALVDQSCTSIVIIDSVNSISRNAFRNNQRTSQFQLQVLVCQDVINLLAQFNLVAYRRQFNLGRVARAFDVRQVLNQILRRLNREFILVRLQRVDVYANIKFGLLRRSQSVRTTLYLRIVVIVRHINIKRTHALVGVEDYLHFAINARRNNHINLEIAPVLYFQTSFGENQVIFQSFGCTNLIGIERTSAMNMPRHIAIINRSLPQIILAVLIFSVRISLESFSIREDSHGIVEQRQIFLSQRHFIHLQRFIQRRTGLVDKAEHGIGMNHLHLDVGAQCTYVIAILAFFIGMKIFVASIELVVQIGLQGIEFSVFVINILINGHRVGDSPTILLAAVKRICEEVVTFKQHTRALPYATILLKRIVGLRIVNQVVDGIAPCKLIHQMGAHLVISRKHNRAIFRLLHAGRRLRKRQLNLAYSTSVVQVRGIGIINAPLVLRASGQSRCQYHGR